MKIVSVVLLVLVVCVTGCHRVAKWNATYDKHVRATYTELVRSYELCQRGDIAECSKCLAMAAAESKYIRSGLNDPNKPVTMDRDFADKFIMLEDQLARFNSMCASGDIEACRDGARNGVNGIGVVIGAASDVNVVVRYNY